jgi:hypothetical protein
MASSTRKVHLAVLNRVRGEYYPACAVRAPSITMRVDREVVDCKNCLRRNPRAIEFDNVMREWFTTVIRNYVAIPQEEQ